MNSRGDCLVFALGGNALGNTPTEQQQIVKTTATAIVNVVKTGKKVVICHGNGPQVGMINLSFTVANQTSNGKIPTLPLPEAVSMSQGYIGFHLQNAILNELQKLKLAYKVVSLVSTVEVDKNDPAFQNPSKPIGSFYTEAEAKELAQKYNWVVKNDANRGWRRFVASPQPKTILEKKAIHDLLETNHVVIAAGGGGVPVYQENGQYFTIPAVVDKDWTAAKLASELKADKFVILTAVDYVSVNYGKTNELDLKAVNVQQLQNYCQAGQFGEGSMLPKVLAVIDFVNQNANKVAIISSLNNTLKAIEGKKGTIITKN